MKYVVYLELNIPKLNYRLSTLSVEYLRISFEVAEFNLTLVPKYCSYVDIKWIVKFLKTRLFSMVETFRYLCPNIARA